MSKPPLADRDPDRARVLQQKIDARLGDLPRHFRALRVATAEFGEGFSLAGFDAASRSADPADLNRVKAIERGVDLLYNYTVELAAFGLELAELRSEGDAIDAPGDLRGLRDAGVIASERCTRLLRLARLRRDMVHDYTATDAEAVHDAAELLIAELPPLTKAFGKWRKAGYPPGAD